ncbi:MULTISPECIES: calcium/proton exchanger [unclassified Microcystis]|jgi:Ca2+:H+ antiporter|uniref:calcium/proton exchanger n=1 Tax=unclassified Microcystis TaxID=2643300 RepID=UPI0025858A0B|nr:MULTISPECIES: calcium/proton exchanger [unclassified Microcystis]MCA2763475.1 calcium/proton exchanger [Microcystis sp. M151S2]MCA2642013.1 calcium/proton exchanger [Microcystis sp. M087S2]MCA2672832.1 calcium/proton exchanger [Microcystis sp. M080S2]MCA2687993.1 calcium/proton exchanger [Microcystis sp. M037S2]MCA2736208.1 calcium/proton exchanger [Microcystis sp. M158S2]
MNLRKIVSFVFLLFIPLSVVASRLNWGDQAIFITAALSIIPLSIWLSTAVERVAVVTGPALGGLVNAIFGNTTTLVIALIALKKGLVDIVQASITGSILSDLLLFMGMGMLTGGIRYKEQEFKPILARVNGSSMTLAVIAIALPTLVIYTSNVVEVADILSLSLVTATVLLIVYGLTLLFSLKTHSYLYEVGLSNENTPDNQVSEEEKAQVWIWLLVLLTSTVAVAYESDLFVDVVESVMEGFNLTPLFIGVIFIPLISDVSGIVTVTQLALKNQMDLTVSVAMGDSLLVALFVAPLLVFIGQFWQQPMDLNFNPFNVVALIVAVVVTNLISFTGRSNWLDGTLLLATYLILAVAFYYHPA